MAKFSRCIQTENELHTEQPECRLTISEEVLKEVQENSRMFPRPQSWTQLFAGVFLSFVISALNRSEWPQRVLTCRPPKSHPASRMLTL